MSADPSNRPHPSASAAEAIEALDTALHVRTQQLQMILDSIAQGVFLLDADMRLIAFNERACILLNLSAQFLQQQPTLQAISTLQTERGDFGPNAQWIPVHARDYILGGGKDAAPANYIRTTRDGRALEVQSTPLTKGGMVRTFTDVTAYVQAQKAIQESEERWKLALESTGDGVWDWRIAEGVEYFSKRLLEMFGFTEEELAHSPNTLDGRTHPDDQAQLHRDRQLHFDGVSPTYVNEHRVHCKDGSWKWVLSRGMVISRDAQGQPLRMIGTHTDITERKEAENLARTQAFFDTLTGLPNRRMLRDRLEHEIKRCQREHLQLAILFIDLDHFKEVNDTLGHGKGDALLIQASERLLRCVRNTDTVARMGGDEFTMLLPELHDPAELQRILQSILDAMGQVFDLNEEQVFVSASIGVTMYPTDGEDVESLFKNADQALYAAKGAGRNRFSFFTSALQEAAQLRVRLANDLRVALTEQQFQVVYQPIVEFASGKVHKAEALLRWQHPTRGMVSPATFIPIAESSGLIVDIGEWVFQQAQAQVQLWRAQWANDFQISINRSPVQFQKQAGAQGTWHQQLQAAGLPGNCIVIEITEGLLLDTSPGVTDQLLDFHDAGIQVSLDDFGTGYSSLAYLQKFDIDFIKIDQSFVKHLIPESTDLALCKAIIAMAHALDMQVIAEGVETALQAQLLRDAGCDYGQGYYFSRPIAPDIFGEFMGKRQS